MFLISKYKQTILSASTYQIRETKISYSLSYICCPLSSYSNSLSRNLIQSANRPSESIYSLITFHKHFLKILKPSRATYLL
jgi:hypothetical protein